MNKPSKSPPRKRASAPADIVPLELIQSRIHVLRGVRVIIDADLARFYGVTTSRFNEAVKRTAERFPEDEFRFQLTSEEFARLISQSATSNPEASGRQSPGANSSQSAMSSTAARGGRRKLPWAFTEHGALMAASMLNSPRAVQMSVVVIRAFVRLRQLVVNHKAIASKLAELDERVGAHDEQIAALVHAIRLLTGPDQPTHRRRIGFQRD